MRINRTKKNVATGNELSPQIRRNLGHAILEYELPPENECVNRFERRLKAKLERQKNKQATNPPNQTAQKEQLKNRKA
jgi:hypothetical protein